MYLQDDDALARVRMPFNRKLEGPATGGGRKVYVDFQARPFNQLAPGDMLDTTDLCRLFRCSARTLYRWIAQFGLEPRMRVGRQFLFTKREITRWYSANRPRNGRPSLL